MHICINEAMVLRSVISLINFRKCFHELQAIFPHFGDATEILSQAKSNVQRSIFLFKSLDLTSSVSLFEIVQHLLSVLLYERSCFVLLLVS